MNGARRWWRALPPKVSALLLLMAVVVVAVAVSGGGDVGPGDAAADAAPSEPAASAPHPPPGTEPAGSEAPRGDTATVARVIDGDTVELVGGTVVRLVQIDAPEVRASECYADEATAALTRLIPPGTAIQVEQDPALDQVDRYGRRLAYLLRNGENVNLALVREGAASVWFYRGAQGRYADEFLAAADDARATGRGLWGACDAVLDPLNALATAPRGGAAPAPPPPPAPAGGDECHPAYDPCLPVVGDMNCSAVRALGRAPVTVRVRGVDPYHLDGDGDGIGCQ